MEMEKRTKASCFSNLYFVSASFLSKGHSSAKFKECSVLLLLSAITSPQLKNLCGLAHQEIKACPHCFNSSKP